MKVIEMVLKLMDIQNVKIDPTKTIEQKRKSFLAQIKNPYHFMFGDTEISLEFIGTEPLEQIIINHISKK